MRKVVAIIILFYLFSIKLWSQGYYIQTGATIGDKFYIASLPKNSASNYQKLQIEIFGGDFGNETLGSSIYSISTRYINLNKENIRIIKEQRTGNVSNYQLKVYETDSRYDFVVETTKEWLSINVKTSLSQKTSSQISPLSMPIVTSYTGNGIDITNSDKINMSSIYMINNSGNVGIGTENPQNKLDVVGTIRATEVKVEASPWSDFVFDKDYKLPTLQEVENHINEHKHLPDIPSEAEVKENGVSLGEMQAKLLQKIEELTLYTIELNKTVKEQGEKMNKQAELIQELQGKKE